MKKHILIAIITLLSATTFAQPSAIKPKSEPPKLSTEIKYSINTDTLSGIFIIYDKEGYLKKQEGKVIRSIKVWEKFLKPEFVTESYYTDKWIVIKREDFYDFKPF